MMGQQGLTNQLGTEHQGRCFRSIETIQKGREVYEAVTFVESAIGLECPIAFYASK